MNAKYRRSGFTLIEVLIVVIIMALLAATIIPQFTASTTDAKKSAVDFNAHTMRSLLQMYQAQHNGKYPVLGTFADQMSKPTDITGATTADPADLKFGPYLQGKIPSNPFNNKNTLVAVATAGIEPTAVVSGGAGWQYDSSTGGFYPNNTEYFTP